VHVPVGVEPDDGGVHPGPLQSRDHGQGGRAVAGDHDRPVALPHQLGHRVGDRVVEHRHPAPVPGLGEQQRDGLVGLDRRLELRQPLIEVIGHTDNAHWMKVSRNCGIVRGLRP
jgi:hypothetical protein